MKIYGRGTFDAELYASSDVLALSLGPVMGESESAWTITVNALAGVELDSVEVGTLWIPQRDPLTQSNAARIVAGAYAPGVRRWVVSGRSASPNREPGSAAVLLECGRADTSIVAPDSACVWSYASDGLDRPTAPAIRSSALAGALVASVVPAWLVSAAGTNTGASALYLQAFNSDIAPIAGATADDETIAPAHGNWQLPIATPWRFNRGIALAFSSTPGVLTPAGIGRISAEWRPIRGLS